MKKVSDLYCVRHDSESCDCREQLSLPNVNYKKFEFTETPHAHVEWRGLSEAGVSMKCVPMPAAVIPILGFAWSAFALSFPFPIDDAAEMRTAHGVLLYINDSANHDPGDENPRDYSVT